MSFRFHRGLPNISIFHSPSSPPSTQALTLLRTALSHPYPPPPPPPTTAANTTTTAKPDTNPPPPLSFNLDIIQNTPPTPDQLNTILSYLSQPVSHLLSAHPTTTTTTATGDGPNTGSTQWLHDVVSKNPRAMKWPVVVNWEDGQVAVGDIESVKGILESLRRKRDGEEKSAGDVHQPTGWFT